MPEGKGEGDSQRGGTVDQTPGSNPSVSQLGGAGSKAHCVEGTHYFGRDTSEQIAAGGTRGQKRIQRRDQGANRLWYWADSTVRSLGWEAETWAAALGKG